MDIVHPLVAGIDVHKRQVTVAIRLPGDMPGERRQVVRNFRTFWRALQKMAAWLSELGVTDAAMESTGVYWWPVYHALAGAGIEVCVCNAAHMHSVPGRKTDPLTELRGEVPRVSGRIAGRVATFPDHDHRRGGAAGSVAAGGAAVRIA
jgi:transposase